MRRLHSLLAAALVVLVLAGCGGSGKPATSTAAGVVTTSQSTAPTPTSATTGAKNPAKRKATAPPGTTTRSATSTTPTVTTRAATPKPKSPVACMVRAGLLHVGRAVQTGTWQGTDPVSHRPIYVDGPYPSPAAAKQSATTLIGVSQEAAGGVWEVSASLRGGTGPAVRRVAACLGLSSTKGAS
jgi:hypothetical protein